MADRDLCFTPAAELVRLYRGRKASPLGITLTGLPVISVPCGFTRDGWPVGLQIVGRPRQEAAVLRAAAAFEAAAPWADRVPPGL